MIETLGRAAGPRGEVALRRRTTDDGGTHLELVDRAYARAVAGGYLWHEFGDTMLFLP